MSPFHHFTVNLQIWGRTMMSLGTNKHYNDVIMSAMASQITTFTVVYSTVYSSVDQRKHQSFVSLAFVRGIHRWPVNSTHKGPVTQKMFPFDGVIMLWQLSVMTFILWLSAILFSVVKMSLEKLPLSASRTLATWQRWIKQRLRNYIRIIILLLFDVHMWI